MTYEALDCDVFVPSCPSRLRDREGYSGSGCRIKVAQRTPDMSTGHEATKAAFVTHEAHEAGETKSLKPKIRPELPCCCFDDRTSDRIERQVPTVVRHETEPQ